MVDIRPSLADVDGVNKDGIYTPYEWTFRKDFLYIHYMILESGNKKAFDSGVNKDIDKTVLCVYTYRIGQCGWIAFIENFSQNI